MGGWNATFFSFQLLFQEFRGVGFNSPGVLTDARDPGTHDGHPVKLFVGGDPVIGRVGVVVVLHGLQ